MAEGAIMCCVYAVTGVSHPILGGTITGVLAMVPFAAPIAFIVIAASIAQAHMAGAIAILAIGAVMLFVVDHFIRPAVIGDAAKLPFLWVLLGILGGVETFGLIGLFVGPTVMAVVCSLWRDWSEPRDIDQTSLSSNPIPPT
jgi:predicted PurR-regulated permease PerM